MLSVNDVALGVVKLTNGWRKVAEMSPSASFPVSDQRWLPSPPNVQPCRWIKATPVIPAPHWLVEMLSVAVGSRKAGPTPQIRPAFVGALGEKKKL